MIALKIIGPFLILAGIITTGIVFYQFFTVDPFEEPPSSFGLLFIAFPTIFVGFVLTGFGFSKEIRQKNVEVIREQMRAAGEGLKEGFSDTKFCKSCGTSIPTNAKFCSECGSKQT